MEIRSSQLYMQLKQLQTLARRKIFSLLQRDSNPEAMVSNPIEALKKKIRLKFAIA